MTEPQLCIYKLGEGVIAFSSTRHGGFSKGHYANFNINHYCGDDETDIAKNRALLCEMLEIDESHLLMPHQVHLTEIVTIDNDFLSLSAEKQKARLEGVAALMTNLKGVCIGVSTADCIPVLLYDQMKRVSCAIHAGWRGTVKRIVEKAVGEMGSVYGSHPEDIVAQIGPGIHLESFEVGDEVYETFVKEGFQMESISQRYPDSKGTGEEKWHIDLPECNRQQLLASGIPHNQINVSASDTFLQHETFFSARRLGINSGRIFTGILMA